MKKYLITSLTVAVFFAACLKEEQILHPGDSNPVLEIYNEFPHKILSSTSSKVAMYRESFPVETGVKQPFTVVVNYAGAESAPQDIKVTLGLNEDALNTYNDQFFPDDEEGDPDPDKFVILPETLYDVATWDLTIKKGEKKASITIMLSTSDFDYSANYGLPIAIKSASIGEISGNYGTILFSVKAKNKYDGNYERTSRLEPVADRANVYVGTSFKFPYDQHYVTLNENTVEYFDYGGYGDYPLTFRTPTGWSRWGTFCPVFEFDLNTDALIDVRNAYINPSNGRSASLNPNVTDSRYDPATKTIYAAYYMNQPGMIPVPIYDTLVYVGDR